MMRKWLHAWRLRQLRESLARRCELAIDPGAKVNIQGIAGRPPARLIIGPGTVFEGRIASDRDGSVVEIGRDTFIGASMLVCAQRIEIGSGVLISWGCTIVDHNSHAAEWRQRANDVPDHFHGRPKDWSNVRIAPVKICDRVWIGFNSIILRGVTVGEGAVIGCGSVVTKDVEPYSIVAGNPARLIRRLDGRESAAQRESAMHEGDNQVDPSHAPV